jgi:ribosomal protein L12E/L44/L45/RPP1/RPP2
MATAAVLPISGRSRPRSFEAVAQPKTATIDQAAKNFLALKLQQSDLEEQLEKAKTHLIALVAQHGAVPPKAEKSKRLAGDLYEVTATYGTTTSVDTQAAERLLLVMIEAGMDRKVAAAIHESLFVFQPKYALSANALKTIAGKLPKGAPRNLRALFNKAVKTTTKSPTLSVTEIGAK